MLTAVDKSHQPCITSKEGKAARPTSNITSMHNGDLSKHHEIHKLSSPKPAQPDSPRPLRTLGMIKAKPIDPFVRETAAAAVSTAGQYLSQLSVTARFRRSDRRRCQPQADRFPWNRSAALFDKRSWLPINPVRAYVPSKACIVRFSG